MFGRNHIYISDSTCQSNKFMGSPACCRPPIGMSSRPKYEPSRPRLTQSSTFASGPPACRKKLTLSPPRLRYVP